MDSVKINALLMHLEFSSAYPLDLQLHIITFHIMIDAMFSGGRKDDATNIPDNGLVLDAVTYSTMTKSLIKEGLLEESDSIFLDMEKSGCIPESRMLNFVVRSLLLRGDLNRARTYLFRIYENNFSLEASTAEMLISLSSNAEYREYLLILFPEKYHFQMKYGNG
jgi:pentatricopeptide repeat protein